MKIETTDQINFLEIIKVKKIIIKMIRRKIKIRKIRNEIKRIRK